MLSHTSPTPGNTQTISGSYNGEGGIRTPTPPELSTVLEKTHTKRCYWVLTEVDSGINYCCSDYQFSYLCHYAQDGKYSHCPIYKYEKRVDNNHE